MASNYPTSLDTTSTLPAAAGVGANLSTFPHSTLHGNANDAIIAIETELGLSPSGADTTVKARLDRITPVLGPWTVHTPGLTQTNVVTFTTNNSTYMRVGRMVHWRWTLTVTGSGSAGGLITLTLPVNIAYVSDYAPCGHGQIMDVSVPQSYLGPIVPSSAALIKFQVGYGNAGTPVFYGPSGPTLAVNDIVSGWCIYEAASD